MNLIYKTLIFVFLLALTSIHFLSLSSTSLAQSNRCDVFKVRHDLNNDKLTVYLDTDCPESAILMVSINRVYDVNRGTAYSETYLSEKSTIGEWKTPRIVDVSHAKFKTALKEAKELMSRLGEKYEVGPIEDNIKIRMVIPIPIAKDLVGDAVVIDESWGKPLVKDTAQIYFPLSGNTLLQGSLPSLDPYSLEVGVIYEIQKETLLLPEQDPLDPSKPLGTSKAIRLKPGSQFKILAKSDRYDMLPTKYNNPWYKVVLVSIKDQRGRPVKGWINSLSWGGGVG